MVRRVCDVPLNCGRQKESMKGSPVPGPGAGAVAEASPDASADVARAQPDVQPGDVSRPGDDVSISRKEGDEVTMSLCPESLRRGSSVGREKGTERGFLEQEEEVKGLRECGSGSEMRLEWTLNCLGCEALSNELRSSSRFSYTLSCSASTSSGSASFRTSADFVRHPPVYSPFLRRQ